MVGSLAPISGIWLCERGVILAGFLLDFFAPYCLFIRLGLALPVERYYLSNAASI